MAWTTPGTATAGDVLTAAFWNTQVRDQFTEFAPLFTTFTSWTPVTDQGVTTNIATSTNVAAYVKIGRFVFAWFRIIYSGNGTGGSAVQLSFPVPARDGNAEVGSGWFFDSNTAVRYAFIADAVSTTRWALVGDWSSNSQFGITPNIQIASPDQLRGYLIYEAAS